MSPVLPAFHPASYTVVAMLSDKPRLGSLCVCVCMQVL